MNAQPDIWVTRDGRSVPIEEMEPEHLQNTINFLRRRAPMMRLVLLVSMLRYIADAPDGAAMACEADADHLIEMSDEQFLAAYVPQWKSLLKEKARRLHE